MKKTLALIISLMLAVSLSACGKGSDSADHSNSTVTGEIQSIKDTTVTLQLGELSESGTSPAGEGEDTGEAGLSKNEPPDMPSGEVPSEVPGGNGGRQGSGETPPEKPDGEAPGEAGGGQDGAGAGATPPEKPDGNAPGDAGGGQGGFGGSAFTAGDDTLTIDLANAAITLRSGELGGVSDLAVGDVLSVELGDNNTANAVTVENIIRGDGDMGTAPGDPGGGMSSGVDSYTAVNAYTEDTDVSDAGLSSTGTDENAVLVSDGASVMLNNVAITRSSDSSTGGDNASFYGVGAAALVTDGTLNITNSQIDTDASGGAGVFAYGNGIAYVSDTTIKTAQGTSGGIHVAGGGRLYAWDLDVETNGASAAAIRSDRGSGTMVVNGGSYTSGGSGSPAVYSTADITINNAALTATGSEAICIEGLNTIRLFNCDLSGNMPTDNEQNDCVWNVILYQSMSGDSEAGNSTFEMVGGTLAAKNGGMFYTTNTESTFILSGVDITYADDSEFFLKCTGNSNARGWGSAGANGADCHFTAIKQDMAGDVIWDSISQLDFYILDGSSLTGAIIQDESNSGNGGDGYAALHIDANSTWTVTGDSILTTLQCEGSIVDMDGKTVSIIGTDGTIYAQGTSSYTVTVKNYSSTVDVSGASALDSWSDYEVSMSE